jgi:tetratricopeptide (TPR) repeat protein
MIDPDKIASHARARLPRWLRVDRTDHVFSIVEEAQSLCTDAIILAEEAGDRFTQTLARRTLAEVLGRSGQPTDSNEARRTMLDAIKTQEEIGAKPELARSYVSLAWILKMQGKGEEAASFVEKAMRLFGDLNMRWDIARATQAFEPRPNVAQDPGGREL